MSHTRLAEITPDEFPHGESNVHGRSHIHRVMFWVEKVCISNGLQDILPEAICAARLHDLARKHDGVCLVHGARATTLLPKYEEMFRRAGATDLDAIEYACTIHCLPTALDKEHPHFLTAAALRDADALDRFRLHGDGPKLDFLNFQRSEHFLRSAKALARTTLPNDTPMTQIFELGENLANPARGATKTTPDNYDPEELPRRRRNRRLKQCRFATELGEIVENLETIQIEAEIKKTIRQNATILQQIELAKKFAEGFVPATYIRAESLKAFHQDKTTKGLWELPNPTWHTNFSASQEAALDARAYNDNRLWGEKGRGITYGVLICPEDKTTDTALRKMYGEERIIWKKAVLDAASFCMNDSQENPFCLPIEVFQETILRSILHNIAGSFPECRDILRKCPKPFAEKSFHFMEFQVHQQLTPDDIAT